MNRRTFLASSAAAVASAPLLFGMTRKADTPKPVIGSGEHKYECNHTWTAELPGDLKWQTTHGTAIDRNGLVYITHQGSGKTRLDTVIVFDGAGKFVRSFGKEWHGGGHGIDIRSEGTDEFIYLCHVTNNGPVVKTTLKGEVVWTKGRPDVEDYKDPKAAYKPTNVAFGLHGDFFVSDGYGSGFIQKFDKDGKLIRTFGGKGKAAGKFETPHGLWVDARTPNHEVLVVCDRANARLQTFTLDGEPVGMTAPGTVLFPAHIDIRGDVMLVPDLYARISLFDKTGTAIVHLGDDEAWRKKVLNGFKVRQDAKQWEAGKFVHPHDACFDPAGNIIVAEWVEGGRITFLKKVA